MKPWEVLGRARMPDGTELTLTGHPSEFAILADGETLMTSRNHQSESLLGTVGCDRARRLARPVVLIGGLGMGFTLRAALDILPPDARVLVAELSPEVLAWNRGPLGPLANHPLTDPRVRVEAGDVTVALRSHAGEFDAILLDVDNGPLAMSAATNAALYDKTGVALARAALRPGGVLAVWSAGHNHGYEKRLRAGGLDVRSERVMRHGTRRGGRRHTIILAFVATSSRRAARTPSPQGAFGRGTC
jgi:spermidine synthase